MDSVMTVVSTKVERKDCKACGGTGVYPSGVCGCGQEMKGHSVFENHTATEISGACPYCEVKPKVLNRSKISSAKLRGDVVYIGRPSKWGNPFSHLPGALTIAKYKVETREEAVAAYEVWIKNQPELIVALPELKGKDLVCWCAPKACHGDVLLRLANDV